MKKLKLNLETVEVLSFPTTTTVETLEGSVHGAMFTRTAVCGTCEGTSVCCPTAAE